MKRATPGRFDAFRLSRERGALSGTVDAADFGRLSDRLVDSPAPFNWRIEGDVDAMGRPALVVAIDGTVTLECQRCLGPLEWPVSQRTQLLLARDDAETATLDEESDAEVLLASAPIDPLTLIEDELVLTLPYVARHAADACEPPAS